MEKTGCEIICGAPTTLAVKGQMMMMMVNVAMFGSTISLQAHVRALHWGNLRCDLMNHTHTQRTKTKTRKWLKKNVVQTITATTTVTTITATLTNDAIYT